MFETLAVALVAFALNLTNTWYPDGKGPETPDQRTARKTMSAEVVVEVALERQTNFDPIDAAALIMTIWYHESALDYHVHAGSTSPIGHQDHGKARCMGQIQTWPGNTILTKKQHSKIAGLSRAATKRCAVATLAYLAEHAKRCYRPKWKKDRWKHMRYWEASKLFGAYGRGRCGPHTKKSKDRSVTWRKIRKALLESTRPLVATGQPPRSIIAGAG